jgi:glucan phosphoethanolaminetransferase (alkaline phosphatase superfamily)
MLNGVMLLWFVLTAAALLFVIIDIRTTPESAVLKWGFVLVTAYTGVVGAFLYVLGCREPLPGLHERYIDVRWRQALGSAMHCVAGDGVGILVGAVLASVLDLSGPAEVVIEYVLGFTFGWAIFQALFMRDMAGGSYTRALATTFIPELLSMNLLMAGMIPTVMILKARITSANHAAAPGFWFVMSMGLLVGFVLAYPMNWWLVANHLKHGMATIRPAGAVAGAAEASSGEAAMRMPRRAAPHPPVPVMALSSFLALGAGVASAFVFR